MSRKWFGFMRSKGEEKAVQNPEEENDEWEDDGDWDAGEDEAQSSRPSLPDGWSCTIGRSDGGRYSVSYQTERGDLLSSRKMMHLYLETRPDLDAGQILSAVDFSQKFGRRAFHLGMERMDSNFEPMKDADARDDAQDASDSGSRQEAVEDPTAQDEVLARTMQAAFDEEARANGYIPGGVGNSQSDHSDGSSYSSEDIGDVAAGGWRLREAQHDEECAEDHDISCLEVRKVSEAEDGQCAVCQEEWKAGDEQRVLPCDHRFHTACVDRWLKQHKAQCPLCKKDVRDDWEDEEEEVWDPVAGQWMPVGGGPGRSATPPPAASDPAASAEDDGVESEGSWETVDSD